MKKVIALLFLTVAANASVNLYTDMGMQLIEPRAAVKVKGADNISIEHINLPSDITYNVPVFDAGIEWQKSWFGVGAGMKILGEWNWWTNVVYKNDIGTMFYKGSMSGIGGYTSVFIHPLKNTILEYKVGRMYNTGTYNSRYEDLNGYYTESSNKVYSTDWFQEFTLKQQYIINEEKQIAFGIEVGWLMMTPDPVVEPGTVVKKQLPFVFGPPALKPKTVILPVNITEDSLNIKLSIKKYFSF